MDNRPDGQSDNLAIDPMENRQLAIDHLAIGDCD